MYEQILFADGEIRCSERLAAVDDDALPLLDGEFDVRSEDIRRPDLRFYGKMLQNR